jgi:hypothetical protein
MYKFQGGMIGYLTQDFPGYEDFPALKKGVYLILFKNEGDYGAEWPDQNVLNNFEDMVDIIALRGIDGYNGYTGPVPDYSGQAYSLEFIGDKTLDLKRAMKVTASPPGSGLYLSGNKKVTIQFTGDYTFLVLVKPLST